MNEPFPILLMVGPHGTSSAEKWVSLGIQAAAQDLIHKLQSVPFEQKIYALVAEPEDQMALQGEGIEVSASTTDSFHFGHALVDFIQKKNLENIAYFGAGSNPLASIQILEGGIKEVFQSTERFAVVNNLHSTDWAIFNHATDLDGIGERLPSDNQIGWVLKNEFGYRVKDLPISAATRADIDTPTDLLMMHDHPDLGEKLRAYLGTHAQPNLENIAQTKKIMTTPASHLTIIGRASSRVWHELEKRTQIWTRMFVEERGMVASGRMASGEVKSLLAEIVQQWGVETFVDYLGNISDAVLWDTRVWMAHQRAWPSKADRFASDLGLVGEIEDSQLRNLTEAMVEASIPIISGGHGVVAGGLFALLESITPI